MRRLAVLTVVVLTTNGFVAADEPKWIDLVPRIDPGEHAVAGDWSTRDGTLSTSAARSSRIAVPYTPGAEYDFEVAFTRRSGVHSVALFFTVGGKQATFEIDAWGQNLAGIQSVGGRDMRQNGALTRDVALENGKRYTATVRVRRGSVTALLGDRTIATVRTDGSDLSTIDAWRMPNTRTLGLGAYEAATDFHTIRVRNVTGTGTTVAATPPPTVPPMPTPSRPMPRPMTSRPTPSRPTAGRTGRVLIVIATEHFFYREYAEPRRELERAGLTVEVAAGRRQVCRPHANSGQGNRDGSVRADLALADVDPDRYDAILFSGGWGSSMYQFAFEGRYDNPAYNGDRATKQVVNRLINEFAAADKYVAALCHGTSVLAWARIDGKSPLAGVNTVAPARDGPSGVYFGRRAQPPCRWNAERNGAKLSPFRSIGDPRTSADDVIVDGRIVTGEDDASATEMGRTLARLLRD